MRILATLAFCLFQFSQKTAALPKLHLNWTDCGKGNYARMIGATPDIYTIGKSTAINISIDAIEDLPDADLHIQTYWGAPRSQGVTGIGGPFSGLNCSGDAVRGDVCDVMDNHDNWKGFLKLFNSANRFTFEHLHFPIAKGPVDINMRLLLSGMYAESEIQVTSVSDSGEKVFCIKMVTGQKGKHGRRPLTFADCGDSETHGQVVGVSPLSVKDGEDNQLIVKTTLKQDVKSSSGKFYVQSQFARPVGPASFANLAECRGPASDEMRCHLWLGLHPNTPSLPLGTIKSTGIKFPMAKGPSTFNVELWLNPVTMVPLSLYAWTYTEIKAITKSGEDFFCVGAQSWGPLGPMAADMGADSVDANVLLV